MPRRRIRQIPGAERRSERRRFVKIGPARRVIEVEPAEAPVPSVLPEPQLEPAPTQPLEPDVAPSDPREPDPAEPVP